MAALDGQVFVVVAFFVCISIQTGNCLQCYSCNSARDDVCDDTFSFHAQRTVPLVTCENSPRLEIPGAGPNTHCAKTRKIDSASPQDYAFRGCVPENYCRLVKSKKVELCQLCDHDRCNSSLRMLPSGILGVIVMLIIRLIV